MTKNFIPKLDEFISLIPDQYWDFGISDIEDSFNRLKLISNLIESYSCFFPSFTKPSSPIVSNATNTVINSEIFQEVFDLLSEDLNLSYKTKCFTRQQLSRFYVIMYLFHKIER